MAVNKLFFATTNTDKLREAEEILGIKIAGVGMKVDEIQSLNCVDVAEQKAKAYYQKLKKPLFVEDASLEFMALNGLPGTYIKDFYDKLGNDGLVRLLKGERNRKAVALTVFTYIDARRIRSFVGKVQGIVAEKPKGKKGFGWDAIFIPGGSSITFGQMEKREKHCYSMRAKALKKFKKWLDGGKI